MKLKVGDLITVTVGKDKGKTGTIEKVFPKEQKIVVPGINMFKRHVKPTVQGKPSGIIDTVRPIVVTKVALVCPKCKKLTRVGYMLEGDEKKRVCKKCQATL